MDLTGIETKASQFAKICERDGFTSAVLGVYKGRVASMSLFESDGAHHYFRNIDGSLYEMELRDEEV